MARDDRVGLTAAEGRKFGLTVGIAFAVIAAILAWRDRETAALVAVSLGGLLVAAGLFIPTRLDPVRRGWMAMALAISRVTTPVFMSLVYFLVITPVGVLRRIVSTSPLRRDSASSTYWQARTESPRSDLDRQF